jgi:hypothetical protein
MTREQSYYKHYLIRQGLTMDKKLDFGFKSERNFLLLPEGKKKKVLRDTNNKSYVVVNTGLRRLGNNKETLWDFSKFSKKEVTLEDGSVFLRGNPFFRSERELRKEILAVQEEYRYRSQEERKLAVKNLIKKQNIGLTVPFYRRDLDRVHYIVETYYGNTDYLKHLRVILDFKFVFADKLLNHSKLKGFSKQVFSGKSVITRVLYKGNDAKLFFVVADQPLFCSVWQRYPLYVDKKNDRVVTRIFFTFFIGYVNFLRQLDLMLFMKFLKNKIIEGKLLLIFELLFLSLKETIVVGLAKRLKFPFGKKIYRKYMRFMIKLYLFFVGVIGKTMYLLYKFLKSMSVENDFYYLFIKNQVYSTNIYNFKKLLKRKLDKVEEIFEHLALRKTLLYQGTNFSKLYKQRLVLKKHNIIKNNFFNKKRKLNFMKYKYRVKAKMSNKVRRVYNISRSVIYSRSNLKLKRMYSSVSRAKSRAIYRKYRKRRRLRFLKLRKIKRKIYKYPLWLKFSARKKYKPDKLVRLRVVKKKKKGLLQFRNLALRRRSFRQVVKTKNYSFLRKRNWFLRKQLYKYIYIKKKYRNYRKSLFNFYIRKNIGIGKKLSRRYKESFFFARRRWKKRIKFLFIHYKRLLVLWFTSFATNYRILRALNAKFNLVDLNLGKELLIYNTMPLMNLKGYNMHKLSVALFLYVALLKENVLLTKKYGFRNHFLKYNIKASVRPMLDVTQRWKLPVLYRYKVKYK